MWGFQPDPSSSWLLGLVRWWSSVWQCREIGSKDSSQIQLAVQWVHFCPPILLESSWAASLWTMNGWNASQVSPGVVQLFLLQRGMLLLKLLHQAVFFLFYISELLCPSPTLVKVWLSGLEHIKYFLVTIWLDTKGLPWPRYLIVHFQIFGENTDPRHA